MSEGWTRLEALKAENKRYADEADEARELFEGARDRIAELEAALSKINDIRNSIVGYQAVSWSAHVYPLVAALEEAGIKGEGPEKAREMAKTQHDRIAELKQDRDKLKAELAAERQLKCIALDRAVVAENRLAHLKAELDATRTELCRTLSAIGRKIDDGLPDELAEAVASLREAGG